MSIELTDNQLAAVVAGGSVRVAANGTELILIRADEYERVKSLLEDEDIAEEMAPLIWEVMKEDWEDPAMDRYDAYPEK